MKNTQKSNHGKKDSDSAKARRNESTPISRVNERSNSDNSSAGRNEKPSSKSGNQTNY